MSNHDYQYREDVQQAAHGSFAAGLLFGAVAGAAAALLLAPRSGSELRGQIAESANDLSRRAHDGYEAVKQGYERARQGVGRAGEAVSDAACRAEAFVSDVKGRVTDVKERVSERSSEKVQSWS